MFNRHERLLYLIAMMGWLTALLTSVSSYRASQHAQEIVREYRSELLHLRAVTDSLRREAISGEQDLPRIPPTQLPLR